MSVCKVCGCTDNHACHGGCYWTDNEHTLCSQCAVYRVTSSVVTYVDDSEEVETREELIQFEVDFESQEACDYFITGFVLASKDLRCVNSVEPGKKYKEFNIWFANELIEGYTYELIEE